VPRGGEQIRLPDGSNIPLSIPWAPRNDEPRLSLELAPNPARTTTLVEWQSATQVAQASILRLLDLTGRELRRWVMPSGVDSLEIDVAGMPAGVYAFSITSDDASSSAPLIRE
jgi:hypothetical protein